MRENGEASGKKTEKKEKRANGEDIGEANGEDVGEANGEDFGEAYVIY